MFKNMLYYKTDERIIDAIKIKTFRKADKYV